MMNQGSTMNKIHFVGLSFSLIQLAPSRSLIQHHHVVISHSHTIEGGSNEEE